MHSDSDLDRPSSSLLYRLVGNGVGEGDGGAKKHASKNHALKGHASTGRMGMTRREHAKLMAVLRWQIEQDLLALFATRRMSSDTDLSDWPLVERSVLNFGIPDLSGITGSGLDTRRLQRELVAAIKYYEPRLKSETLKVTCHVHEHGTNDVVVLVEALFGPNDAMESFAMAVSICLGSGQCRRINERQAA